MIELTEVGPRDGLQNEKVIVSTEVKKVFIEALVDAGVRQIEVGSFVSPKWVPAMADTDLLFQSIEKKEGVRYLGLVPNLKGYERARAVDCDAIALFTAATEGFVRANINMSIKESLEAFSVVAKEARREKVAMRGYVSTVFACPFDGKTKPQQVLDVVKALLDLGCYEVSLGDTIGVGTPKDVEVLLDCLLKEVPKEKLVMHFHDTWGMGVANALRSIQLGMTRFDASAGGLGGCPFAKVATGNVPTEDLLYLLEGLGLESGYDLSLVVPAAREMTRHLKHPVASRVNLAYR